MKEDKAVEKETEVPEREKRAQAKKQEISDFASNIIGGKVFTPKKKKQIKKGRPTKFNVFKKI